VTALAVLAAGPAARSRPAPPERDAGRASVLALDPPSGDRPGLLTPMRPSATTSSDTDLVDAARAGDHHAFAQLMRRYDDRMRGLAYKLLADRSKMDDALQESYLKAFRALDRFKDGSDFGTWLYRITYNTCIDELRRARRSPLGRADAAEPVSGRPGPEREVTAAEAVRQALATLPPDQRVTVVLVDGEGFDNATAAKILGVAPGTVASRLHRARAALRAVLGDELGEGA
jgi:RNA polymerase sigma-70 factor, ECF subfamily